MDVMDSSPVPDIDYRKLHENFVSNHTGTSPQEILLVSEILPVSLILYSLLGVSSKLWIQDKGCMIEFSLLSLPLLAMLTCCSEPSTALILVFGGLTFVAILLFLRIKLKATPLSSLELKSLKESIISKPDFFPFVTNYRASMLLTTAICILAVDFTIFPRKFAKTEHFGFGLMDIGVGSFVFAGGLVSQEARKGIAAKRSASSYLLKSLGESVPMLLLGFARLISVKGTGYHEHVTEYGIHWNFFFTLAFTKVLVSIFFCIVPVGFCWISALFISISHEFILNIGVASWMISRATSRDTIFEANREGICSLPGYVAIYLAGVSWGNQIFKMDKTFSASFAFLKKLVIWSLVMWSSTFYSWAELHMLTSRQLCNWSYFNWMVAFNLTILASFLFCDLLILYFGQLSGKQEKQQHMIKGRKRKTSSVDYQRPQSSRNESVPFVTLRVPITFAAITKNALVYFLFSNLLTGLVNMSIRTMHVTACPAILIIFIYMIVLHLLAMQSFVRKIKLKFW